MDEIRAALYPEIRVGWAHDDAQLLEVMDQEQECLAKSLGDGHRLVRGVAGSGKTEEDPLLRRHRLMRGRRRGPPAHSCISTAVTFCPVAFATTDA